MLVKAKNSKKKFYYFQLNESWESEFLNNTIPAPKDHDKPVHTQAYTFTNLTPNSSYMLQLRARNTFGHSDWTDLYQFFTAERKYTGLGDGISSHMEVVQ